MEETELAKRINALDGLEDDVELEDDELMISKKVPLFLWIFESESGGFSLGCSGYDFVWAALEVVVILVMVFLVASCLPSGFSSQVELC
ncbi:hypothetical protein RHMOL_Rhmol01G0132900 [Rhododendron molle]|uniref:Uncharacterized protein n=1 Tax=Rhododendron molle TaxID=49168 RepID=A0ACC0Q3P2_RHOML|nr:hypothetical protein RHMOL_Rhmol01G0132900 [Rhododendron molle]